MAVLPTGFGNTIIYDLARKQRLYFIIYESFVILKDTSGPNQTPSIGVKVPCRSITEDQILWVVAFDKKGNLLKDMASNKY